MYTQRQKTLRDLTPEQLGRYAQNILVTGCPLVVPIDYTPDPTNDLAKLTESECEEIIRYANVLAEKEGLGKDYFNPEAFKKNLSILLGEKPSDLEEEVRVKKNEAALFYRRIVRPEFN